MERAVKQWASEQRLSAELEARMLKRLSKSYTIYGCMLVLPPTTFSASGNYNITPPQFDSLCALIALHLKVTHIAINRPIPPMQSNSSEENILRAPTNFTPIYGDFGPSTCAQPVGEDDYSAALWVTAKQNGIYQTWAPRWTMFSRGNISEKARLLTLPSVMQAVEEGRIDGHGSTAVDLYAGIGYFAFSYVRAGISKVLCWDLNPWSIEGLRRGARANKWHAAMWGENAAVDKQRAGKFAQSEAEMLVFNETNEHAPRRIREMHPHQPPVRHVNCGMLPSSRESLRLAAAILDPRYPGWVHVHENFAVAEIDARAEDTRVELHSLVQAVRVGIDGDEKLAGGKAAAAPRVRTEIVTVFRLKSYAPGVMHCVIDICVWPDRIEGGRED